MSDEATKRKSLINKSVCRDRIFRAIEGFRPGLKGKMTRVSADVYEHLDSYLGLEIDRIVISHPTVGKTVTVGRVTSDRGQDDA